MVIDINFDFRSDTPPGCDPDLHSPTLRRYHRQLWSKPLPDGRKIELSDVSPGIYLHHHSEEIGELQLASDSVMQTFIRWKRMQPIIQQMDDAENDEFMTIGYTIGGMLIWPSNKIGTAMTINGARGFVGAIADRIDLTLECIRRHYLGDENSPLNTVFRRYGDFFALFGDFGGYVEFFHLQDLIERNAVRFFTDFDGFGSVGWPQDITTYRAFRRRSIEFLHARNARIAALRR